MRKLEPKKAETSPAAARALAAVLRKNGQKHHDDPMLEMADELERLAERATKPSTAPMAKAARAVIRALEPKR